MNESKKKGDLLELAVEAIERNLLEKHKGAEYSIARNKIIIIDGARHEIDVLVRIMPDTPYESLHAFECKNLKSAVEKSTVSSFIDVVNQIGAAKGTIIARSFSKSAKALVEKHSRLELVEFKDLNDGFLECNHLTHYFTKFHAHVTFGEKAYLYHFPDGRCHPCVFQGEVFHFDEFCHGLMNDWLKKFGVFNGGLGEFSGSIRVAFNFIGGELTLCRQSIRRIILEVAYEGTVSITRPTMAISIDKKGCFMKFDFDKAQFGGNEVSVHALGRPC